MTATEPVVATQRGGDHRLLVGALATTQTLGYGVLSYAFAVFLTPMARDLDTSTAAITATFTLAVLVAAAAAIPVGRWIDRHGGRGPMVSGSVLGALAVLAWSTVDNLFGLYLIFVLIGLASAMVLYEPAFAVIVHTVHTRHRATALLAITIVAGFASTIFLPLTGALADHHGWRTALRILAILYALIAIPLHAATLPRPTRPQPPRPSVRHRDRAAIRNVLRDRGFWLLLIGFTAHSPRSPPSRSPHRLPHHPRPPRPPRRHHRRHPRPPHHSRQSHRPARRRPPLHRHHQLHPRPGHRHRRLPPRRHLPMAGQAMTTSPHCRSAGPNEGLAEPQYTHRLPQHQLTHCVVSNDEL